MHDTISDFETGVLATQARTGIARLREFTTFNAQDEAALDRTMALLAAMLPGASAAAPTRQASHAPATPVTPAPSTSQAPSANGGTSGDAEQAFSLLRSAHPSLGQYMADLNWVTLSGGLHVFRHARTHRSMTFDPRTKVVSGTLDNGETSHDAATVLRVIATI